MFCRTFIFAFLAVGTLAAKLELSDKGKTDIKTNPTTNCPEANSVAAKNVDFASAAVLSFYSCFNQHLNVDIAKAEIKAAKDNGTVAEVVKKYCDKTPELKTCLHKLSDGVNPCVQEGAKDKLNLIKNTNDRLIDYVCYKDGDRITQFLTENGFECFQSTAVKTCYTTTQTHFAAAAGNLMSLPLAETCRLSDELSTCTLKALETCSTPTAYNILQSLHRYVREGTACNDLLPLSPPK